MAVAYNGISFFTAMNMQVVRHRLAGSKERHVVRVAGIGMNLGVRMYQCEEQRELSSSSIDD